MSENKPEYVVAWGIMETFAPITNGKQKFSDFETAFAFFRELRADKGAREEIDLTRYEGNHGETIITHRPS